MIGLFLRWLFIISVIVALLATAFSMTVSIWRGDYILVEFQSIDSLQWEIVSVTNGSTEIFFSNRKCANAFSRISREKVELTTDSTHSRYVVANPKYADKLHFVTPNMNAFHISCKKLNIVDLFYVWF